MKCNVDQADISYVKEKKVWCEGEGNMGHPRVYLHMGSKEETTCPYCGKRFVME